MGGLKTVVMGLDPGLTNTGFGVVRYEGGVYHLQKYGVITTQQDAALSVRLLELYNKLYAVLDEYRPCVVGIEMLFFSRNAKSALMVSNAIGVIELCLAQQNIKIAEFTPNQIKKAVTGITKASKENVEDCVKLLLKMDAPPKPDHASDALAAAITAINYGSI